jgi:hypothetical protein
VRSPFPVQLPCVSEEASRSFPRNTPVTLATGKLLHNAHDSLHLLAGFLASEHHIFMLAPARLRE